MSDSTQKTSLIKKIAPLSLTLISCSFFVSCGNFDTAKVTGGVSKFAKKSVKSVAGLMPSRLPVAEVREKDLQQMPSGADRALAWDRHLDSKRYASLSRWFIPKNYKAPTLPTTRSIPTGGSILPPLQSGQGSHLSD